MLRQRPKGGALPASLLSSGGMTILTAHNLKDLVNINENYIECNSEKPFAFACRDPAACTNRAHNFPNDLPDTKQFKRFFVILNLGENQYKIEWHFLGFCEKFE